MSRDKLVPRLRFPEFRKAGSWEERTLKQLTTEFLDGDWIESKDQSESGFRLVQTGNIGVGVFIEKSGKTRYVSAETFVRLRCTEVFPSDCLVSRLPDPAGRSCLLPDIGARMITAVDCTIVRFDEKKIVPSLFIAHSQTENYFREVAALSSGSTRQRISRENLSSLPVFLPGIGEQQKIADCLTSLDEVIAAQGRKVEALKAHKRGLMQQLFPREDETRPRLRFPEFRDAPDWVKESVSALISTVTPPKKVATSGYQSCGRLAIVDQSPADVCGWTDDLSAKVDASLPLLVFGDHTCVLKLVEHDFAQGADGIKIISAKPRVDIRFLFFGLQVDPIVSASYRRHFSLLQEKSLALPREVAEQQRIADCLSSLDTQITAESNQLAALKTHKQGLMQQLFPSPEDAAA